MAKKKYFTSWDEMIIGIREDCEGVFDEVCEALCVELNDMITAYTYQDEPEFYDRQFEMDGSTGELVKYKKIGNLNAEFYFDDEPIATVDNPHHHIIEQGGTMEELVDLATWGRVEDIKAYIVKRFPQLYRKALKGDLPAAVSSFTDVD